MRSPDANKFAGCLIGQCLGDALGFIVEGQPTASCSSYIDDVVRTGKTRQLRRGRYSFGQYSDDSQLARELILSIVDRDKFDPADYAGRIAALFREDRIVGRGFATQAAADRLMRGIPWDEAGTPPPSAGNGSAMRAAPVGLFCFGCSDDKRKHPVLRTSLNNVRSWLRPLIGPLQSLFSIFPNGSVNLQIRQLERFQ